MQKTEKMGLHKLNTKTNAIMFVIAYIAILFAILNLFRMPFSSAQHDVLYVEPFSKEKTVYGDHLDYIREIADNNRLPQSNKLQYYHPPLHHFICAMFLKVFEVFTDNKDIQNTLLQIVPLIEYILLIVVICKFLKTLHINGKYKILLLLLLIMHPSHFMLSRSLNNDMLVMLLVYTTLWRAIKWYQRPTAKNIILTGIFAGLAVMTKVSGGLVAIPILYLLIKRIIVDYKKSENKKQIVKKYIGHTLLLGCTALPLGLWYPIRNYIRFNQSFFYVLDPTNFYIDNIGDKNLWQRFGLDFTTNAIYFEGVTSYNIPLALIQTSVIGELGQTGYPLLVSIVVIMNMAAIVFSIYCYIKTMFGRKAIRKHKTVKIALMLFLVTNLISYIMMNLKLTYPCTMHFRYLLQSVFIALLGINYYLEDVRHKNKKKEKTLFYIILFFTMYLYIFAYAAQ